MGQFLQGAGGDLNLVGEGDARVWVQCPLPRKEKAPATLQTAFAPQGVLLTALERDWGAGTELVGAQQAGGSGFRPHHSRRKGFHTRERPILPATSPTFTPKGVSSLHRKFSLHVHEAPLCHKRTS